MSATVHPITDPHVEHALDGLEYFFPDPDDVIELRALGVGKNASNTGSVLSGYFMQKNKPALAKAIRSVDSRCEGAYFTVNKVNRALLARAANRLQLRPKNTTSDADIIQQWDLYVDCDAVRPAGISATDLEHQAALDRRDKIRDYLTSLGWPEPLEADSGNGGHLHYRLPAMDLAKALDLCKRILQALSARFSDSVVKVDTTTCNPARICKLYGTMTRKGDPTDERPHRRSRITAAPERAEPVPLQLLEKQAALAPESSARPSNTVSATNSDFPKSDFDIDAFIARSGFVISRGPEPYNGGRKWTLKTCPFNESHILPVVLQLSGGALAYRCLHDSCANNDWHALRALVEPNRARANRNNPSAAKPAPEVKPAEPPKILNVADLFALDVPAPRELIEGLLPFGGAALAVGKPKSGKTVVAVQCAIAVASGHSLFDYYRILEPGPAMVVEQDDPSGPASVKDILLKSRISVTGIPFFLVPKVPFYFGLELLDWLEKQITAFGLKLVVLDSYTALRAARSAGCDLVKTEQTDLVMLDELAKQTGCTILVVHHGSKGSSALEWDQQAAGSFAMAAAVESQIHISRFADLDLNAPERLVRVQGRHLAGTEFVLRFRKQSIDYDHVLDGGAASVYPLIQQIQVAFGAQPFSPKELSERTGVSRATAHRHLGKLYSAGVLSKRGFGEYTMGAQYAE